MSNNDALRLAIHKGYRANRKGVVTSPSGLRLKLEKNEDGYLLFKIWGRGRTHNVRVHRLIAYQKFGEAALEPGIVTRHINGQPDQNNWGNIRIGTHRDNTMDQPPEVRQARAQNAANHCRRFSRAEIAKLRAAHKSGKSYKTLSILWAIPKSQLSYILSKKAKRQANY